MPIGRSTLETYANTYILSLPKSVFGLWLMPKNIKPKFGLCSVYHRVPSGNFNSAPKLNSAPKILLVKTYGNTFFIEGELWLFRWKFLIARWKESAHSYTCMPLYGSKCSETSFVRYSNMSFDAIVLIFCCFLACLMYGNNCFQSFQHRTKTRMCSCEDLLSNALSNAFNERVKVLLRWKTCYTNKILGAD